MPRRMARETIRIMNAHERDQLLYREGPVLEEHDDWTVTWEVEREWCNARWSDGPTDYRVARREDGRWGWSVTMHGIDPLRSIGSPERSGVEDSYQLAHAHLSILVTEPDRREVVGLDVFDASEDVVRLPETPLEEGRQGCLPWSST